MKTLCTVLFALFSIAFVHGQEICDNGIDDDNDGLIDLNDTTDCVCAVVTWAEDSLVSPPSMAPNSNFEDTLCCPAYFSQLNCATGWVQATSATSDFLHTCSYYPPNLPLPPSGSGGVVGAIVMPGYLEYVGSCLNAPMLAGTQYTLEIQIACEAVDNWLGPCVPTQYSDLDMTIYGNASCGTMPISTSGCPTSADPSWIILDATSYTPDSLWSSLSFTFTPTVDMNAIIIGAPCGTIPPDYGANGCLPYFIMDDLILNTTASFGYSLSVDETGGFGDSTIVLAGSSDTLAGTFQWFLDGVAIPGETDTVISLMPYICWGGSGVFTLLQVVDTMCQRIEYPFNFPGPAVTQLDVSICPGDSIFISGAFQTLPGVYHDTLASSSACDSIVSTTLVYSSPIPSISCSPSVNLNIGTNITFSDSIGNNTSWLWDFGDTTATSTDSVPTHSYANSGVYTVTLTVTDGNGCTGTETKIVAIMDSTVGIHELGALSALSQPLIPSVFSPNADGKDDVFLIRGGPFEKLELIVYNTWGQQIFESTDQVVGWDGTQNGKPVAQGLFVYSVKVTVDAVDYPYVGKVILIR
jgi:gliding motility-associated-like protein